MARAIFDHTFRDANGDPQAVAITMFYTHDSSPVLLYSSREGDDELSQPVDSDDNGRVVVYGAPGLVDIGVYIDAVLVYTLERQTFLGDIGAFDTPGLGLFQLSAYDPASGSNSAVTVTVRDPDTLALLTLYEDAEGTIALGNPFTAATGIIEGYCRAGRVRIEADDGFNDATFDNRIVLDDWQPMAAPVIAATHITGLAITVSVALSAGHRALYASLVPQYRESPSGSWTDAAPIDVNAIDYTFTGLDPETGYHLRLEGETVFGETVLSNQLDEETTDLRIPAIAVAQAGIHAVQVLHDYSEFDIDITPFDDYVTVTPVLDLPVRVVAFNTFGTYMAVGHESATGKKLSWFSILPDLSFNELAYPVSGEYPPGQITGVDISNNNNVLAVTHDVYPWFTTYWISPGTGVLGKLPDPDISATPPTALECVRFTPDSTRFAVGGPRTSGGGWVLIYETVSMDLIVTMQPLAVAVDFAWHPNNEMLATALQGSPPLQLTRIGLLGDYTIDEYDLPAYLPEESGLSVAFSPDGTLLVLGTMGGAEVYTVDGAELTHVPGAIDLPAGTYAYSVRFSRDGTRLAIGHDEGAATGFNYVSAYAVSGSTFTRLASEPTVLVDEAYDIAFNDLTVTGYYP